MDRLNRSSRYIALFLLIAIFSMAFNAQASSGESANLNSLTLEMHENNGLSKALILQDGKAASPEEAARRLYNAWRTRNRRAALKVATREAVNDLFRNRWKDWGPMKPGKNFCDEGACYYFNKGGGTLEMGVDGGASVGGYNVTYVSLFWAND